MATMTEEPHVVEAIDEGTGHRIRRIANTVDDEAALRRAQQPDRPDPPSGGPERLCNATTGVIVRRAFVILLHRAKPYQGLSSGLYKYQVEPRSRLV